MHYPDPSWIGSDGMDYRNEDYSVDPYLDALEEIQNVVNSFTKAGLPTVPANLIQEVLDGVLGEL